WLLLAILSMLSLFYFPIYKFEGALPQKIGTNALSILLCALSILLSFITLISFKKRKNQIALNWLNILVCIGLQAWLFYTIDAQRGSVGFSSLPGYYWIGCFVPIVTLIFLFMSHAGMRKDEKLIKTLDPLRSSISADRLQVGLHI